VANLVKPPQQHEVMQLNAYTAFIQSAKLQKQCRKMQEGLAAKMAQSCLTAALSVALAKKLPAFQNFGVLPTFQDELLQKEALMHELLAMPQEPVAEPTAAYTAMSVLFAVDHENVKEQRALNRHARKSLATAPLAIEGPVLVPAPRKRTAKRKSSTPTLASPLPPLLITAADHRLSAAVDKITEAPPVTLKAAITLEAAISSEIPAVALEAAISSDEPAVALEAVPTTNEKRRRRNVSKCPPMKRKPSSLNQLPATTTHTRT
jgi:hypothetical protein